MEIDDAFSPENIEKINKTAENIFKILKDKYSPFECMIIYIQCLTNTIFFSENEEKDDPDKLFDVINLLLEACYQHTLNKYNQEALESHLKNE